MQSPPLLRLLHRQVVPTPVQGFVALILSATILLAVQIDTVSRYLGITAEGVRSFQDNLHLETSGLLTSPFASNFVLVAFWGMVGLIAYLITWAVMNLIIEARNTVTIDTRYKNRGHWRGPWQTLGVKTICLLLLVVSLMMFQYVFSIWLGLSQTALQEPNIIHIVMALGAWIGLAAQLYAVYLLVILTVTPWYRTTAFTE